MNTDKNANESKRMNKSMSKTTDKGAILEIFETHLRAGKVAPFQVRDRLVLRFEQRQKARQRARLSSGREIGIQLPRGTVLRGGDFLQGPGGEVVRIVAAAEPISIATSSNPLLLAKAAYHLGNRHVSLEVGRGYLHYLRDHVLDHMVESLGLRVTHGNEAFEPEAGAYAAHSHSHSAASGAGHGSAHSHGHDHGRGHSHDHDHEHDHDHPHDHGHEHEH